MTSRGRVIKEIEINSIILNKWEKIINKIAKIFEVPCSLIMRVHENHIEVLIRNQSENNPYKVGETAELEGLYCTHVMETNEKLLVPNALDDPVWKNNPDVKLNMISYLGFPVHWPDNKTFGTICVLDTKTNAYSEFLIELLEVFRDIIESNLELVYKNFQLEAALKKIEIFEELLPVCAYCKKIKNEDGNWQNLEDYLMENSKTVVTHGICPKCFEKEKDKLDKIETE